MADEDNTPDETDPLLDLLANMDAKIDAIGTRVHAGAEVASNDPGSTQKQSGTQSGGQADTQGQTASSASIETDGASAQTDPEPEPEPEPDRRPNPGHWYYRRRWGL